MDSGVRGLETAPPEDREKQPGNYLMETRTADTYTSQATVNGALVQPELAAKRDN